MLWEFMFYVSINEVVCNYANTMFNLLLFHDLSQRFLKQKMADASYFFVFKFTESEVIGQIMVPEIYITVTHLVEFSGRKACGV